MTYRQLDYWARTALVEPSIRDAAGSGSQRLYSFTDIVAVRVIKRLLDAGVSLQNVRVAVECLRGRGIDDLAAVTLVCDGASVYECTTDDQIIDLLRGGQGVFGIAIGHTTTDIAAVVVGCLRSNHLSRQMSRRETPWLRTSCQLAAVRDRNRIDRQSGNSGDSQ